MSLNSECIKLFQQPQIYVSTATNLQWTSLISEARQQALLGTIHCFLADLKLLDSLPAQVKTHLLTGFYYAEKQKNTLLQELVEFEKVFENVNFPCVLVKGVGYRVSGLAMSRGRIFSDIDLLIPHDAFPAALSKLLDAGYLESGMSDYDRRYYVEWSHQHPPLTHFLRGANIDLHHHIFPVSSNSGLTIAPMLANAQKISGSAFSVPTLPYLFIHAAVHLFYQEETHKLVKDLVDLYQLYLALDQQHTWQELLDASEQMHAGAAVYYALDTLRWLFKANIEPQLLQQLAGHSSRYRRWQMQLLLSRLLANSVLTPLAHFGWYIRGHLLKMGVVTLLYHSVAKIFEMQKIKKQQSALQRELDDETRPKDAG